MPNDNADISVNICLPDHIIAACKQIHITSSHNPNKYVIQIIDSKGNKKYVLPCATPTLFEAGKARQASLLQKL
jgi:hypothetical protein